MSRRHTCAELGVCQVEGALAFDLPCPQPCGACDLRVTPLVADGGTFGVEISRIEQPRYVGPFPFAPGAIEHHQARPTRGRRLLAAGLLLALAAAVAGLAAGYARGRGWL